MNHLALQDPIVQYCAISGLINGMMSTVLGLFVISRNFRNIKNITYFLFCVSVSVWSYSYFLWQIADTYEQALLRSRQLMAGAIFIPVFYLHHIFCILNLNKSKSLLLKHCYAFSVAALTACFTPYFVKDVSQKLAFRYWPNPGVLFHIFLFAWVGIVIYGAMVIFWGYKNSKGLVRNQMKYILVATIIGWGGGITNYFLWYDIPFLPMGNILVSVYVGVAAYVIIRFRLMDVSVALTRTTIFLLMYGLIIGIPIALVLGGKFWLRSMLGSRWWIPPVIVYVATSTVGPFLYMLLQRKAEERLLKDQRRYQQTLLQASRGMTLIKDLKRLLNLTVHVLTRTIGITHASIFLFNEENHLYERKAQRDRISEPAVEFLPKDSAIVESLCGAKEAIVAEEIRFQGPHPENSPWEQVEKGMERLQAAVVIPSFVRDKLIGFLVLGDKRNRQIYSQDDLNILSTLANQAALAIENCRFIEEFDKTQAVIFQTAKMKSIGDMASGIGHQMNNRLNHISLGSDLCIQVNLPGLRGAHQDGNREEFAKHVNELEKRLYQMKENAMHGRDVVEGLLDFARISEKFEPLKLADVVKTAVGLWRQYRKDLEKIDFSLATPGDPALIRGNFSTLEEVVINFLNNAVDAWLLKEEARSFGKLPQPARPEKGAVQISVHETEQMRLKYAELKVEDTGIGMTEETMRKLYVPFFTTKATSIKGTGLGMFLIKKIVDAHNGEIYVDSRYGEGTTFRVLFPLLAPVNDEAQMGVG